MQEEARKGFCGFPVGLAFVALWVRWALNLFRTDMG